MIKQVSNLRQQAKILRQRKMRDNVGKKKAKQQLKQTLQLDEMNRKVLAKKEKK